jgi:hypothetical protein
MSEESIEETSSEMIEVIGVIAGTAELITRRMLQEWMDPYNLRTMFTVASPQHQDRFFSQLDLPQRTAGQPSTIRREEHRTGILWLTPTVANGQMSNPCK